MLTIQSVLLNNRYSVASLKGRVYSSRQLYAAMAPIEPLYPNFKEWFFGKICNDGLVPDRAIFLKVGNGRILGVGIAKRSVVERKLCTLWVDPSARNLNIGSDIAEAAFDWLGTQRPLFTVPEERLFEFRSLLKHWDFKETQSLKSFYRKDKTEHVFNGSLLANLSS